MIWTIPPPLTHTHIYWKIPYPPPGDVLCSSVIWALGSIINRQRGINKTYQKVSWTPKVCAWVPMLVSSYLFLMDSYLTSSHGKDHPMISCVYFEFHRSKLYAEKVLCLKLHIISLVISRKLKQTLIDNLLPNLIPIGPLLSGKIEMWSVDRPCRMQNDVNNRYYFCVGISNEMCNFVR